MIYVDEREPAFAVEAVRRHCGAVVRRLDDCDYLAGGVCVERKTVTDLVESYGQGRLAYQLERVAARGGVLIVEGYLWRVKDIHAILAALASRGVAVIPSRGVDDTAKILCAMDSISAGNYTEDVEAIRIAVLGLLGVGARRAAELLKQKSLAAIICSGLEGLPEPVRARARRVLGL